MKTLDQKIDSLKKGEQIEISSSNSITVSCERSTNGKQLRFVRTFADGSFNVFKKVNF